MKTLITLLCLLAVSGCATTSKWAECNKEPDGYEYCPQEDGAVTARKMSRQEIKAQRKRQQREAQAPYLMYWGASMLQNAGRSRSPQPLFGPVPMPASAYQPQQQPYTIQGVNEDGLLEHTTIVPLGDGNYRYYTTGD